MTPPRQEDRHECMAAALACVAPHCQLSVTSAEVPRESRDDGM